ncbi:DsbA family oxidoreductase [Pedobacter caeni]|uniref:Predicted dithiol-disulfide isomerase, DsbA family n=1 Tax=Pedobacter caeni TaxID=288992 RepID=A0A1M4V174_9SPHI|nr:DsbA family oxidoreductase [Pedobacter caeni]SHE62623.1 Predicted dithiol-disulfide isomerase, DsbA family [Pedobacter caeni]
MKVDIWSDVRCPFCYIGKRKFEAALAEFEHKDAIEVEWHSFELDRNTVTLLDKSSEEYLAERYGKSREWAAESHQHVTDTAAEVGLKFHLDKSIVANSFNAHRLIQLAKSKGRGDEMEEALFKAHFTDGKNIDDQADLTEIAKEAGLDVADVTTVLNSADFTDEVRYDEKTAEDIGVRGVPFFVFNEKLAVSGAQPAETFLGALKQAWEGQA